MSTDPYKVVLVGESGVGKTCIIEKFNTGKYDPFISSSITANFFRKTLEFPEGKSLTFDIWDTAGQEKYRSIDKIFYKDANAVVLVYSVECINSFFELKNYWYEQIKKLGDEDIIIAIVANKSDLSEEIQVTKEAGKAFAKEIGAIFFQVSAKYDMNVQDLFYTIGKKIIKANSNALIKENKKLKDELLNKEKMIEKFKKEIIELKKINGKLKDDNNKLENSLHELSDIILELNKKLGDQLDNTNKINNLNELIKIKDNIIKDLKYQMQNQNLNNDKKLYSLDDILCVRFITADQQIDCPIKCLKTDTFAEVEEKLYLKFEKGRETNNNFIANGNTILRFKKITENKIKDGDKIQMLINGFI